jgi:hypothetical protein
VIEDDGHDRPSPQTINIAAVDQGRR